MDVTITIDEQTQGLLSRHALRESSSEAEAAKVLFGAAVRGLARRPDLDIAGFVRALEGGERLDERQLHPAELRTESREATKRLQTTLYEAMTIAERLGAILEDEASLARLAKVRRLRLAAEGEVRS